MTDKKANTFGRAEDKLKRFKELEWLVNAPEVIADNKYWRSLVAEYNLLEPAAKAYEIIKEAADFSAAELEESFSLLLNQTENFSEERAVIEIRAKDDGYDEFVPFLILRFKEFCRKNGLEFSEAGNLVCEVFGRGAYSLLKEECGVHQTGSKISAAVLVYEKKAFKTAIDEKDIKTDIFRSGGAGGQNVNKVESAVRMTHLPTGLVAVCQDERSQLHNRDRARRALKKRVDEYYNRLSAEQLKTSRNAAQKKIESGRIIRVYDNYR